MSEPENEYSYTQSLTEEEDKPRGSYRLLRLGILLAFALLALQLGQLQIAQGNYYHDAADKNRFRLLSTDALRGIVYDRSGQILVRNVPSFKVSIVPADLPDEQKDDVLQKLSKLLNVPIDTVVQNTSTDAVGSLPTSIERSVVPPKRVQGLAELVAQGERDPYSPVLLKTNVPRDVAFYLEEKHLDFPGVQVDLDPVREYVQGPLMSQILGYVGRIPQESFADYQSKGYSPNDQVGVQGLELTFEDQLRGAKGRREIEVDYQGREVRLMADEAPVPGHNLVLSIDVDFQKAVQAALEKGMRSSKSKQGVAIALDPRNGEVLAMVTLPTYDDNLFATGISVDDYTNLAQDPLHPLLDQAIAGQYPPGSVFKLIPASAGLQEHVIDVNSRFQTPGVLWVPNKYYPDDPTLAQPFYDWYKPGFGSLAVRDALAVSSDVFFYQLAGGQPPNFDNGLGQDRLSEYASLFGLGKLTNIDLPGEAPGLVPDQDWKRKTFGDRWTIGDTYNMGIGQGYLLATPLQIAEYTAAVANGGTLYKPQLVIGVTDSEGNTVQKIAPVVNRKVPVDPQYLGIVREGMRNSVTRGTSVKVDLAEVDIAAKTGTAEYYGPKVNGHLPTHAWTTSFAPYENPQIVVTVLLVGGGEGSEYAVPVAADIMRAYFRLQPNSPMAGASQPIAPPVVSHPSTTGGPAAPPAHKYTGRSVSTDGWSNEQPGIFGTVVDANGRGVPGVRVVTDKCDGNAVFSATTDANGAFNFNGIYWHDSLRWCVRTVSPADSDPLTVQVAPYQRYTIEFVPTQ